MNSFLSKINNEIHFGSTLKELLEKKEKTMLEAAKKLNYNLESLYPIFRKRDVNTALLRKVCDVYGLELSDFLGEGGSVPTEKEDKLILLDKLNSEKEIEVLKAKNKGLEEQIKLQRELIEALKAGK